MKTFIITFLVFFTLSAQANSYVDGRGHFVAKSNDSLKFVKDQLLASAFRDILTKELKNMGLDANHFWEQYDAQFETYFTPIKDTLALKYNIGDPKLGAAKVSQYRDALRMRELGAKSKFGKLSAVIQSYSIKKFSRSTKMSNSRYVSLSAKVNRKHLRNIFFRFTREGKLRHFATLYVSSDFSLEAMTWIDAGVGIESDFTNVIKEHWKKWFLENMNTYVDNIVIADVVTTEKINAFFKLSEKRSSLENMEDEISSYDEFNDSLWLKVKCKIKKIEDDKIMNNREFEVSGDFLLIDLKTNKLVKHYDFINEKKKISVENNHDLSSNLASMVYRIPISEFLEIPKSLSSLPSHVSKVGLEINNVKNILDLIKIKELLATTGIAYRFESKIDSYSGTIGSLQLSYQGTNDKIIQTLNTLNNSELEPGRILSIDSPTSPFKIIIKENKKVDVNESSS